MRVSVESLDPRAAYLSDRVQAGDWDEVITTLDTSWSEMVSADPEGLREILQVIPTEILQRHPRWAYAVQYFDRMVSEGVQTRYREPAVGAPKSLLDALARATAHAAAARAAGDLAGAVSAVNGARELLDESTPDARRTLTKALPDLTLQWAMVWEFAGDIDRATHEYVEAYDYAVMTGNLVSEAMAAGALAWVHAVAGRNEDARGWLARLPDTREHAWHARAEIPARLARTQLLLDRLELRRARNEFAAISAVDAAERWPLRQLLAGLLAEGPAESLQLLVQLDAYARTRPALLSETGMMRAIFFVARVVLTVGSGDVARARDRPAVAVPTAGPLVDALIASIGMALADRAGDHERAVATAGMLRRTATSMPRILIPALGTLAADALRRDDSAEATVLFRMACGLAAAERLYLPLTLLLPDDLAALHALAPDLLPDGVIEELLARGVPGRPDPFRALSRGERRVFELLLAGLGRAEVAERLVLSTNTVKTQMRSIYRKAGVNSRAALMEMAREFGYVG